MVDGQNNFKKQYNFFKKILKTLKVFLIGVAIKIYETLVK